MSDKVFYLDLKTGKTLWKRILIFSLIGVLVVGGVLAYVFHDRLMPEGETPHAKSLRLSGSEENGRFTFDASNANQYADYIGGLAVASMTGLSTYDKNGTEVSIAQTQMLYPSIRTGNSYVMAFDAGGTKLHLMKEKSGSILELTAPNPILDADLADDGCICYSTSEVGYKSVLYVYNADQQLIYRWMSSSQYMPVCAVSAGAEYLAATTLGQRDGLYDSGISVFRTDSEDVYKTIPLGNELIFDLSFWDKSTLCVVGEQSARWLGMNGGTAGSYNYNGAYLKDYDFGGSGFLTLMLNMYKAGNRYSVVTVASDGSELGRLSVDAQVLDFSVGGKYIAVLTATKLSVYTQDMELFAEADNEIGATDVVMRKDGSCILISGNHGTIYAP